MHGFNKKLMYKTSTEEISINHLIAVNNLVNSFIFIILEFTNCQSLNKEKDAQKCLFAVLVSGLYFQGCFVPYAYSYEHDICPFQLEKAIR